MKGLYKAIDKKTKKWVYGYYFKFKQTNGSYISYLIPEDIEDSWEECMWGDFIEIIDETLCQFIGLADDAGIKLYENDNVEIIDNDVNSAIGKEYTYLCMIIYGKDAPYNDYPTSFVLLNEAFYHGMSIIQNRYSIKFIRNKWDEIYGRKL